MLLKDQTWSCLFITLILFSTWLYYLLGLLYERHFRAALAIHFLPPGQLLTPALLSSPSRAQFWIQGRCLRKLWLLPWVMRAREEAIPCDTRVAQSQAEPRRMAREYSDNNSFGSRITRDLSCLVPVLIWVPLELRTVAVFGVDDI